LHLFGWYPHIDLFLKTVYHTNGRSNSDSYRTNGCINERSRGVMVSGRCMAFAISSARSRPLISVARSFPWSAGSQSLHVVHQISSPARPRPLIRPLKKLHQYKDRSSDRSIAEVSPEWPDKWPKCYFNEFWRASDNENHLMEVERASYAKICGTRSGWRSRDTASGWTSRLYFAIHVWCPIIVPGNTVIFYSLLGHGHDNAIDIFKILPLVVPLTGRTSIMRVNFIGSE
jgi:hypothetical protein